MRELSKGLVILISIFLLIYSSSVLYSRYFVTPNFDRVTIQCDAEELSKEKYFITTIPDILLENGVRQSTNQSRSGNKSIELTPDKRFGFTYRYYNGKKGDVIKVNVWRYGKSGSIVMVGDSGNEFHHSCTDITETDNNGWDKMQCSYTLPVDLTGKEFAIYIFNNTADTNYFDDISISIN